MTDTNETQPALVLDFGDGAAESFKAHRYANQFLLVRHVEELFGDGYDALKAASILVLDQVLDEDKARAERFLFEHGRSDTYLEAIREGLGKVWQGETTLPLDRPSDSSETTSPPGGGTSSMDDLSLLDMEAESPTVPTSSLV